jgi:hypothetical protein
MSNEVELLKRVYDRFNARDMETVLAAMHENVTWEDGMEGGHVQGRDGVRSYWTRQWAMIDPHVEALAFSSNPDGEVVVDVHQLVRDYRQRSCRSDGRPHLRIENGWSSVSTFAGRKLGLRLSRVSAWRSTRTNGSGTQSSQSQLAWVAAKAPIGVDCCWCGREDPSRHPIARTARSGPA